jgi:zinc transporter ZupT
LTRNYDLEQPGDVDLTEDGILQFSLRSIAIAFVAMAYVSMHFRWHLIQNWRDLILWSVLGSVGAGIGWLCSELTLSERRLTYVLSGVAAGLVMAHLYSLIPRLQ